MDRASSNPIGSALICLLQRGAEKFSAVVEHINSRSILTVWEPVDLAEARPAPGENWRVEIALPVNPSFPPKLLVCEVRVQCVDRRNAARVSFDLDHMKVTEIRKSKLDLARQYPTVM